MAVAYSRASKLSLLILPPKKQYRSIALWAPEMATRGGVQSYMWRLWEMLHDLQERHPVKVIGLAFKDTTDALITWPNPTPSRPLGARGNKINFVRLALGHRTRADFIIVGHINQAPVAWFAKRIGLIDDYVVILHGIEAWRRSNWLKRQSLKNAVLVVATTRFTSSLCIEANDLPLGNSAVIPLCAEPHPEEPRAGFHIDGGWPILFVGRLAKSETYKGLDTLIEAIADLQHEGLPVKLHVIGDGDDRPRLEAKAQELMLSREGVTFHGRVDGATLQSAYRSAKTFAMPSAKEGFGIVFLEAMRHSVPCIGGAHGGTIEVFREDHEGLLVQHGRVEELKSKLRRLVTNPAEANSIGIAGHMRYLQDYTYEIFSERWINTIIDAS